MVFDISVSIVLFKSKLSDIENVLNIVSASNLNIQIFLIDNSPSPLLENQIPKQDYLEYIFNGKNLGYGGGHNVALESPNKSSKFHLVLNADVEFKAEILESIYDFMSKRNDVGLLCPKVLNVDGSNQYSAKLLPNPINLIVRRFVPIKFIQDRMNYRYELQFFDYNRIINVPYLSGCFMFIRGDALEKVKGFDDRFFMYPEDIDLTRRIHKYYKTLFFPEVTIVHEHGKGSYKNKKLLYYHVTSMIKYFNKWGWIFDKERKMFNHRTLKQFN